MNAQRTLHGTFWAMIAVSTLGAIDLPGKGPRKLPAPARYVAATVLWGVFHLTAMVAPRLGRAVAAMSVAVVLTALFVGNAGDALIKFLNAVARNYQTAPAGPATAAGPPQTSTAIPA